RSCWSNEPCNWARASRCPHLASSVGFRAPRTFLRGSRQARRSPHSKTRSRADMFRMQSFIRGTGAAVFAAAAVSGRAAAQRGSLTATLAGHRTTPTSDTVALRIDLQMTPGWHIGAAKPGVTGVPTEVTWRLPVGWRILTSRWPAPTPVLIGRDTAFEYRGPFAIEATLVTDGP